MSDQSTVGLNTRWEDLPPGWRWLFWGIGVSVLFLPMGLQVIYGGRMPDGPMLEGSVLWLGFWGLAGFWLVRSRHRLLAAAVVGGTAFLGLGMGLAPAGTFGNYKGKEICTDCGMVREVSGWWVGWVDRRWQSSEGGAQGSEVSAFLKQAGSRPCGTHHWRMYQGRAYFPGYMMAMPLGARLASEPGKVLPAEEQLAKTDAPAALKAVRERLGAVAGIGK